MKIIPYLGRIVFLSFMITLASGQQLSATIKHSTDEKGTIHINNVDDDNPKVMNKDPNLPAPPKPPEVVKSPEPTPSKIFPKAEAANDKAEAANDAANDEEESKSADDDE